MWESNLLENDLVSVSLIVSLWCDLWMPQQSRSALLQILLCLSVVDSMVSYCLQSFHRLNLNPSPLLVLVSVYQKSRPLVECLQIVREAGSQGQGRPTCRTVLR